MSGVEIGSIRQARRTAGLTQTQAANQIGVTRVTWSAWETGRTTPSPTHLQALTATFNIPVTPQTLKGARQAAGLTQTQTAKALGVTRATVGMVEAGNLWPNNPDHWAQTLGITTTTFTDMWSETRCPTRLT